MSYTYDSNNQLKTITLPSNQAISYPAYRWTVPLQMTMPGAVVNLNYDALLRPTTIKSQAINKLIASGPTAGQIAMSGTTTTPVGIIIQDIRIGYNDVSNITKRETEHGTYQYSYDDLDRLTQVVPPNNPVSASALNNQFLPIESYRYDSVHNRKSSLHQTGALTNAWSYNAHHQLTQWGDPSGATANQPKIVQTFDANGHLKTKVVTPENVSQPDKRSMAYSYDLAERLTKVEDANQIEIASYAYDPFGRRIRKTASQGAQAGTTIFFYADEGLLAETDQGGSITTTYGWRPNGTWGTAPIFKRDHVGATATEHYYHNDHLGTSQRLTNAAGEITWRAYSEAFGKTIVDANFDFVQGSAVVNNATTGGQAVPLDLVTQISGPVTTAAVRNNLRFPGQYADSETGAHYNYFRDYDSATGRYVQSDPIGLNGGLNSYAYVSAQPLRFQDRKGLAAEPCCTPPRQMSDEECCRSAVAVEALAGIGGTVMCCLGRKVPCATPFVGPEPGFSLIRDCVLRHERKHFDDVDCEGCNTTYQPGFKPGRPQGSSECEAYGVEVGCLRDARVACGNDEVCRNWARDTLEAKTRSANNLFRCGLS